MRTGRVGSTGSRGKAAAYATSDARRTSWDQWYFFRNYLFTPKEAEFNLDHSPLYCQYYPLRRTHLRCRSMLNYVHTHSDHHPLHTRFTFVPFFLSTTSDKTAMWFPRVLCFTSSLYLFLLASYVSPCSFVVFYFLFLFFSPQQRARRCPRSFLFAFLSFVRLYWVNSTIIL